MAVDSDLVGVIVACSVVGACLIIFVILSSIFCIRRLENKRRKDESRKANINVDWSAYPPVLPVGPHLNHSSRLGGYRPRILSPSSPGNSVIYNTSSTHRGLDDVRGTPAHQSPNHHPPSSSSSSHHNHPVSTNANGHILVPLPAGYPYYGYASERPDFYDARRQHIPQNEEIIETVFYPDQPYHSTLKDHIKGPAPDVPQSPATNHSNDNGVPQQPLEQNTSSAKGSTKKSPKKKSKKDKAGGNVVLGTTSTESEHSNANVTESQQQSIETSKDTHSHHDEVHANGINYKVIKKQHDHSKMPDWMVRDYGEQGESMELEGEGDTAAVDDQGNLQQDNGVPGMVSVMVRDYSIRGTKPEQQQESSDQHAMSSSTMDESTTSIVQDYSSTNYIKNFSILDYVDPPGGPSSDVNQNGTNTPTGETVQVDEAILEHKAAVLKQIRQKVNESAEQMPPAFTSTPRVDSEMVSSEESSDEMLSRRQRPGSDGSVEALPPPDYTNL